MHQLHRARIQELESDSAHAEHMHLTPEFPHAYPALVKDLDRAEERYGESGAPYAGAHVDIL